MKYIVYIIRSKKTGKRYIGYTQDIDERLRRHNTGTSAYTKREKPWELIYSEEMTSKSEALKREKEIKSFKGGGSLKNLLKQAGIV
ncbi:GIY-YIG nuclease family protein [Candidatus Peregrinibacteria bacterium]|nr:GIY-YIG nuclease family protein [Candidatus Peregrinibacteria bacterium]